MCGIFLTILRKQSVIFSDANYQTNFQQISNGVRKSKVKNRGPDAFHHKWVELVTGIHSVWCGCTLHFRGSLTRQPLQNRSGNLLLWNGEIFGGLPVLPEENDGSVLLNKLSYSDSVHNVTSVVQQIQGPYSLIFWHKHQKMLWLCQDYFGRRSLLVSVNSVTGQFQFSSTVVPGDTEWNELPVKGLYCLQFGSDGQHNMTVYPWMWRTNGIFIESEVKSACGVTDVDKLNSIFRGINIQIGDHIFPPFSPFNTSNPEEGEIIKLPKCLPESGNIFLNELSENPLLDIASQFTDILLQSVRTRIECQSTLCGNCIQERISCDEEVKDPELSSGNSQNVTDCDRTGGTLNFPTEPCGHARVAVLYSGGIDSLVIASLADKCVPAGEPIDLINVAFEQEGKLNKSAKKKVSAASHCDNEPVDLYDVPDRQTAEQGLKVLNQHREWRFVKVNVTKEELQATRESCIRELVYPRNTVLDDSIGCAIWFAARGAGVVFNRHNNDHVFYNSTARVVLVGMGADEQLAGYSRHRTRFEEGGWQGLKEELQMEICRIALRNLGRDDRIISDHGKEARFPFLDEHVVSFLNNLPVWQKTNLHLPRGVGDKYLLRQAASLMGLGECVLTPKRAIQFGSRIAKLENRKEKAYDICTRLQ